MYAYYTLTCLFVQLLQLHFGPFYADETRLGTEINKLCYPWQSRFSSNTFVWSSDFPEASGY